MSWKLLTAMNISSPKYACQVLETYHAFFYFRVNHFLEARYENNYYVKVDKTCIVSNLVREIF